MNNLFIGLLYHRKDIEWLNNNSKFGYQAAANNFQWSFIQGIEKNQKEPIDIISSLSIGSFPLGSKKLFVRSQESRNFKSFFKQLGFINFYLVKGICRFINLSISLRNWIMSSSNGGTIYVYSLYTPYLWSLWLLKRTMRTKNVKYCLIITDLPGKYGILQPWYTFAGLYDRIDNFIVSRIMHSADFYVLLTKFMANPLNITNKPIVVIEGIAPSKKEILIDRDIIKLDVSIDSKLVLYTGSLLKEFGIEDLLTAFLTIKNKNFKLWICGPIAESKTVLEYTNIDDRIKYLGFLDIDSVQKLQEQATVLINPRPNIGEYVKYSFPSKTMEYLLSGTPLIMYKLDGIPNEYDNYIFYIKDQNIHSIAHKINEVCQKSNYEREIFGSKARDFVINNKNSRIQTKKVLALINSM
jgi:glycosyltransferase involved in cell wall biosynthesis